MGLIKGGFRVFKFLMFAFNFLLWLAGTGVFSIALWLRFDKMTQSVFEVENAPTTFFTGVYVLIVAGIVMMSVGFLGCCGAIRESQCMLATFFSILLIILAAEVAAGIWGLSNKNKIVQEVKQFYNETYENYKSTKTISLKEALTAMHFSLQCCGKSGSDIDGISDTCPMQTDSNTMPVKMSCPVAIDDLFNSKMHVIGGVGIGIGLIMIFGMISSMILCCAIRRTRELV